MGAISIVLDQIITHIIHIMTRTLETCSYFCELVVIQVVSRIELENEFVVDPGLTPDHQINRESQTK